MKLYTLISIALSVFGGTYSALSALRTHFESFIKTARAEAQTHLQKISEHYGGESETSSCSRKRKSGIDSASILWNWCNTIPAILFAIFVFFIAAWVLSDWDTISTQKDGDIIDRSKFPWTWFYQGLLWMVILDFLCLCLAGYSWARCKFSSRVLREQYNAVLEGEKKKISLIQPAVEPVKMVDKEPLKSL